MVPTGLMNSQEIVVVCEDHPPSSEDISKLQIVRGILQAGFSSRGDIDATCAQPTRDRVRHMLIKVKPNHAG